jgi:hypothetical protein
MDEGCTILTLPPKKKDDAPLPNELKDLDVNDMMEIGHLLVDLFGTLWGNHEEEKD